jgi:hypothetical protein
MEELAADIEKLFERFLDVENRPRTLFHFTDADALVKIVTSHSLWAPLTSALSDASEIAYPMSQFRELLPQHSTRYPRLVANLLRVFDGKILVEPLTGDFRAYVASFCAADNAIHWSHYGRSGTGVALGFDSQLLETKFFALYRIVYDREEQDRLLVDILDRVTRVLETWLPRLTESSREVFANTIAAMCHGYLRLAAPLFKNAAFRSENEWRLVSRERWDPDEKEDPARRTGQTKFRSSAGRIVPYKEVTYQSIPLTQLVLGHSTPMAETEQALAVLFEDAFKRAIPVTRSQVQLRP